VNGGSDQALPTTATCFSSLSLPPYRNAADALKKIRYAIHSCVTIDCDGERSGESFVLEDAIAHEGAP